MAPSGRVGANRAKAEWATGVVDNTLDNTDSRVCSNLVDIYCARDDGCSKVGFGVYGEAV